MEIADARALAHERHFGQQTRHGDLLTEHLERVASSVPLDAMTVAFLHDLLEYSDVTLGEVAALGLSDDEIAALVLLTREEGESFEAHSLRIAFARGAGSRLARTVKLADLDDHINSRKVAGAPPYGWARQHMMVCTDRHDVANDIGTTA